MPIEIRELVIKANVDTPSRSNADEKKSYGDKKTEKIIQESIDQFSEILKLEKER